MASITTVLDNNSAITRRYGPGLVAVFGESSAFRDCSFPPNARVQDHAFALIEFLGEFILSSTVGGTSGIGESTARAFIQNTGGSRAYLVGRDQTRATEIIKELQQMKPDAQVTFIKSDVSLLHEVDDACSVIQPDEDKVNILFLSPGMGTLKGP